MFILPFWAIGMIGIAAIEWQVFVWANEPGLYASDESGLKVPITIAAILLLPLSALVYVAGAMMGARR